MEKRKMENIGAEPSMLGFGCMRFPTLEDGSINEAEAEKMLNYALDHGVTYVDTAYFYHDGASEPFVGKALEKRDRSSFYLATKLPVWILKDGEDARRVCMEQLSRLRTEYVDFYLLHALNRERWEKLVEQGVIDVLEQLREEGKIRYIGFSFHDDYEVFEEILQYRKWDFCQIQLNYMDTEEQAGMKGYRLAEKLGVPLVTMEPVRGGALANFSEDLNAKFHALDEKASIASYALRYVGSLPNVKVILSGMSRGGALANFSEDLNAKFHALDEKASIASYALRYVGSLPNVKVILSGMSTMEQVGDNIKTFSPFRPLNIREEVAIANTAAALRARVQNGCTGCRYCMPCPHGVDIPGNFKLWNTYHMYQRYESVRFGWEGKAESEKPTSCVSCGKCMVNCPQKINIPMDLQKVQKDFDERIWK